MSLIGCTYKEKPKFKVGQYITNGHCHGQIAYVNSFFEEYNILNAKCRRSIYSILYIPFKDAKLYDK